MVVSIESVVYAVLFLLGAGIIFGLLVWLTRYIEGEFPWTTPFPKFARIAIMVLGVLVLIFWILGLMGHPIIRFG